MRWADKHLYVAGTGVCLADRVAVDQAIAAGRYGRDESVASGQLSACVASPEIRAPDLAIEAATRALRRSGYSPNDVGILLYAVEFHDGVDAWNAASYIQKAVASDHCVAAEIRSGCDGGMIGMELASAWLEAHRESRVAVVTASDIWADPFIDRWRTSSRFVLGDGGAAVVLTHEPGFAQVLSIATVSDPSLEAMTRGEEQFGPFRHTADHPIELAARVEQFLRGMAAEGGLSLAQAQAELQRRTDDGARAAVGKALAEAEADVSEIGHVAMAHINGPEVRRMLQSWLGSVDLARTTWEFGRRIGHLGPGDWFAGFDHLTQSGRASAGDLVLIIADGGGFAWTASVLKIIDRPNVGYGQ
jgi:3-oxoacyl-[acyl-carrier-protein] synthase-3